MKAILALANGRWFEGRAFGAEGVRCVELVFHTAMTGYQEILTDPCYQGQGVVLTAPMAGCQGIVVEADEAPRPAVEALIVREACGAPPRSSREDLGSYLRRHGVIGVEGVDTRALTRVLRETGATRACVGTGALPIPELVARARRHRGLGRHELRRFVVAAPTVVAQPARRTGWHLAVLDCGAKRSLVQALIGRGHGLTLFPSFSSAAAILATSPAGLVISDGPGDPQAQGEAIATVRQLLGRVPLLGIGLGFQLLALSLGGTTYRMRFGHHGTNHPVADLGSGRVAITSQHHLYAVDPASLGPEIVPTHLSMFDGTLEGFRHGQAPLMGVQFRPEGVPGPSEAGSIYEDFFAMIRSLPSDLPVS